LKKTFQTIISLTLLLALTTPAVAEISFEGQPYFDLSVMLASARNSKIDDATGLPHPAFTNGAEVVTNTGFGLSLSGGWLLDSNWRAGVELSYRSVPLDEVTSPSGTALLDGDHRFFTTFFNVVKDFRGSSFVTPYVGVGVGVAFHELDIKTINGATGPPKSTAVTPAFQGMFGVLLEVGEDTDIVVGYRYVNYYSPEYTNFSYDYVDFHNFELGLRFYPEDW
jgi:opacity protein-like surface antigen